MKLEKQSTPVPQLVDAAVEQVTYLLEDKQLRLEKRSILFCPHCRLIPTRYNACW
jgi:hypothetical protein